MAVTPKDAATVVLMRPGGRNGGSPEVLLVRRHRRADFAAGAYVYPGGALEAADASPLARKLVAGPDGFTPQPALLRAEGAEMGLGLLVAAIRETFEEVGVLLARTAEGAPWWGDEAAAGELAEAREAMRAGELDFLEWIDGRGLRLAADALVYFAHWITPEVRPKRFDTRFFAVEVPEGVDVSADRREVFEHVWVAAGEVTALKERGELPIMFPTASNAQMLARYSSPAAALAALWEADVPTILPKIQLLPDGERIVVHPWDEGYDRL